MHAKASVDTPDIWGEWTLGIERRARWQVGPLAVWAYRGSSDWQLATAWTGPHTDSEWDARCPIEEGAPGSVPPSNAELARFAFEASPDRLALTPGLGDRSFVISPELAFHLMPGQRVRLFVTTPLWAVVTLGGPKGAALDVPTFRPSDTWFGPFTSEGELCYASRTQGRLSLDNVQRLAMRVLSAIVLENRARDPLVLERVRLPVPHLSLYRTADGLFWTNEVKMTRLAEGDAAAMNLTKAPPPEAGATTFVRGPRREHVPKGFERVFQFLRLSTHGSVQ